MLLTGFSVQGTYHDENQDSFRYARLNNGIVLALSDGLGSLGDSKAGSEAACASVCEIAEELGPGLVEIDPLEFAALVHARWLEKLHDHDIGQCYATLLFFVLYAGRVMAGRLGDGFLGIWLKDAPIILFDPKEDHFVNETDCLTETFTPDNISIFETDVLELHGCLICSDGIEVGNMTPEVLGLFTRKFIEGYQDMDEPDALAHIAEWLPKWSGSDDKTLVFFIP